MPGLYRSKSVRRLDDNNQFREIIEKDSKKILAAASCQLFISTPQLDKWFKSSAGTLCFIKDYTRKGCYFFRLYSLMQGQLWEQEVHVPYSYIRLSYVFHYITINRFNFGFKFICEDEAERFFNVVKKFQSETANDNVYVNTSTQALQQQQQQSQQTGLQLNDILSMATMNATPPLINTRKSRKLQTASSISSITSTNSSTIKTSTTPKLAQKLRNLSHSSDRVLRKIEKSDISCPFRCSFTDLHIESEKPPQSAPLQRTSSVNSPIVSTTTRLVPQTPNTPRKTPSIKRQAPIANQSKNTSEDELEIAKDLLIKFNLPINRKFVNLLREYIKPYGDMSTFQNIIKSEEEKKKLSAFVAATNAALIAQNPALSPIQSTYSNKSMAPTPPVSPPMITTQTNSTPICIRQAQLSQLKQTSTHGLYVSSTRQQINQSNFRRTETPSPVRSKITFRPSIKTPSSAQSSNQSNEAPPKPPRRSSLKIMV
jgi:hypothetical protein